MSRTGRISEIASAAKPTAVANIEAALDAMKFLLA